MKWVVALLVIAVCAVWSVLLLGPERKNRARAPRDSADDASASTSTAQAPTPNTKQARVATAATAQGTAPRAASTSTTTTAAHATAHPGATLGASQTGKPQAASTPFVTRPPSEVSPAEGTGELGEGVTSPDYVEMESDFMQEPREGAWAIQHEVKIRELFYASDIAEHVVLINCRSTVCRMQFQPHGADPFGDVLRTEGVAEYTGIDSSTPYSLNGGELIIYTRPRAPLATAQ